MESLALLLVIILLFIGAGVLVTFAQRIRRLEDRLYGRGVQAPAQGATTPAPASAPAEEPHKAPAPERKPGEWETQMGAKWFTVVGAVAVLFGVGFFLRYAFEQNLISPVMRVTLGVLAGAVSIGLGNWLRQKYAGYGQSLMGLGLGIFYLTLYAALHAYQFVSEPVAFAGMVVVTVLGFVLARRLNAEPLAILALLGGLLTPMLIGGDTDHRYVIFPYLALLNIAVLALAFVCRWRSIIPITLAGTVVLVGWWQVQFGAVAGWVLPQIFATLYLLLFAVAGLARYVWKSADHSGHDMAVSAANLLAYVVLTWLIVPEQHQLWMGWGFAILGGAYLFISLVIPQKSQKDQTYRDTLAITGLAVMTLAPWLVFEEGEPLLFFAAGVVALLGVWVVAMGKSRALRLIVALSYAFHGLLLFAALFSAPGHGVLFFLNGAFWLHMLFILSLAATVYWTGRAHKDERLTELHNALFILATILAVTLLSTEMSGFVGALAPAAKSLSVSLLWTVYALVLLGIGIATKSSVARKTAMALFAAAVLKVFLYDSAALESAYRFISFIVLGVILLFCGYLYHRFRDHIKRFIGK